MKRNYMAKTFYFQVRDINAYNGRRQIRCFRLHLWTSCLQWIHLHLKLSEMLLPRLIFFSRLHTHMQMLSSPLPYRCHRHSVQNYTTLKIINLILSKLPTIRHYSWAILIQIITLTLTLTLSQFPSGSMPLQLLHRELGLLLCNVAHNTNLSPNKE